MERGTTVLVTGSSQGIGSNLIRNFAQKGYKVIINYLSSQKPALELYQEIADRYGADNVLVVKADVGVRAEVEAMFALAEKKFGQVDILINNAGINIDRPFLTMADEEWTRVINTILTGTFICAQVYALKLHGQAGHIINIGSTTAISGRKNGANYCSARAGVVTLTKCLALELAPHICVNCVTPGPINTAELMERYRLHDQENYQQFISQVPLARLGVPDDIFKMVYFLVAESSYVTGQNFFVDGGKLMY